MFRRLVKEGVDYETFSADVFLNAMRHTGWILYVPAEEIPVKISDNVPPEFRDIWVKHEIACNTWANAWYAHWCRQVSEAEIRELVPEAMIPEYVRHRVAMLRAAIQLNSETLNKPDLANHFEEGSDARKRQELAIAKLQWSLDFFNEQFHSVI